MLNSILLLAACSAIAIAAKPNFVFIIVDDQDLLLSGMTPLNRTEQYMKDQGATLENFFVATPVCCPSRTQTLTGRYFHSLTMEPSATSPGHECMSQNSTNAFNKDALFPQMQAAGYETGHFGKLLNDQEYYWCEKDIVTTGFSHISTSCASTGAYWANKYIVKANASADVTYEHLDPTRSSTYSTAQFGNRSTAWIEQQARTGNPFMAYIGLMAPHLPAWPAPWYQDALPSIPAPRTPAYNYTDADHYQMVANATAFDEDAASFIDRHMANRWRSLLSVDDVVAAVIDTLTATGQLDNTYVIYTSDHGYHLGQYRIPIEKMMPYDTDVRVPTYIRGPGITPGSTVSDVIANVDFAPTILDLAGVAPPALMDGRSFAPLVKPDDPKHSLDRPWRTTLLSQFQSVGFQYFGMVTMWNNTPGQAFGGLIHPPTARQDDPKAWFIYDNVYNSWLLLRIINATTNWAYVEETNSADPRNPVPILKQELYDLDKDPHQLHNIFHDQDSEIQAELHDQLRTYYSCQGRSCP